MLILKDHISKTSEHLEFKVIWIWQKYLGSIFYTFILRPIHKNAKTWPPTLYYLENVANPYDKEKIELKINYKLLIIKPGIVKYYSIFLKAPSTTFTYPIVVYLGKPTDAPCISSWKNSYTMRFCWKIFLYWLCITVKKVA